MKNLNLDFNLLIIYDKINVDKEEMLDLLLELEYPNVNVQVTEYVKLLCINHISLSVLIFSLKENFLLKKSILIIGA
jgi:hypothetical protein